MPPSLLPPSLVMGGSRSVNGLYLLRKRVRVKLMCKAEQNFSKQHSSLANKAYRTLLSPLSRGLYLLELNGVELEKGTDAEADPEFLSEIMEINEKLSDANNDAKIEEMENLIAAKQEELIKDVSRAFEHDDLQEAKKYLAKMKYFANLEEKLKKKKIPS
ncbi:iron-sulfur cluster co-chaperone protein HscB isoform X2 [Podarcis muralis]